MLVVSNSKIQNWQRCRKAWEFAWIKDLELKRKKETLETGTIVHGLLQKYYKGELDLQAEASQLQFDDDPGNIEAKASGIAFLLVSRYVKDFAPFEDAGYKVVATEYYFQVPLRTKNGIDFMLEGYCDLLVIDEHGYLWLWDHKTTSRFWTPLQVMMDAQTPTYAAALRTLDKPIHGIIFNQLNTYEYKNYLDVPPEKLFKRERTYRTPVELDAFLSNLYDIVDDMVENQHHITRSLNKDCAYCFFQNPCLLEMKGVDIKDTLEADYQKRKPRPFEIGKEANKEWRESQLTKMI